MSLDTLGNLVKFVTPLGVLLLLVLQTKFVTLNDFQGATDKLDNRLSAVEAILIRMEAGAETDVRHTGVLEDHEIRIRKLEMAN